jgi:hypothetical protein
MVTALDQIILSNLERILVKERILRLNCIFH